jgi:hypothetical protein
MATAHPAHSCVNVATILVAIETAPAHTARLTAVAEHPGGQSTGDNKPRPIVALTLDGATFTMTPAEARILARCLTWEGAHRHTGILASLFHGAACDAEALACPIASARRLALHREQAA